MARLRGTSETRAYLRARGRRAEAASRADAARADAEAASASAIAEEFATVKKQCDRVLEHLKAQHAADVEEAEAEASRWHRAELEETAAATAAEADAAAAAELESSLASARKDADDREKTSREHAVFAKFASAAKREEERAATDAEKAAKEAAAEALAEEASAHELLDEECVAYGSFVARLSRAVEACKRALASAEAAGIGKPETQPILDGLRRLEEAERKARRVVGPTL